MLLKLLLTSHIEAADALPHLRQLHILCALHDGPFGAQGINALLTRRMATRLNLDVHQTWHHGRPVIVTRNNYARGLLNGDVGGALMGVQGLHAWVEFNDSDGNPELRSYSPRAVPAHKSA